MTFSPLDWWYAIVAAVGNEVVWYHDLSPSGQQFVAVLLLGVLMVLACWCGARRVHLAHRARAYQRFDEEAGEMVPGGADVAELERRIAALSGKEAAVAEERRRLRVRARSLHNELYPPCFGLGDAITRCLAGGGGGSSDDSGGVGGGGGGGRGEGACYLVFLTSNSGCLLMHWSDTPIDGALASFVPAKPVPRFKYTQNAGRTEVARDMNMKVRKFYQGYAYFLKTAANLGGTFRLRTQLKQLPIAVYLNAAALEVKKVRVGESATFSGVKGIAVLPALSTDLDVGTMETRLFLQTAERVGAGLALDSGVGGIDSDLSARRLSRAGSNAAPPSPFVSGGALPS